MPPPVKTVRVWDAERTRAELLAAATQMFAEDGYSGARVDEIAERTRTTKRMTYYYLGGSALPGRSGAGVRDRPRSRAGW